MDYSYLDRDNEKFSAGENNPSFFDFAYLEPFLVAENKVKPRLNLAGGLRFEAEAVFNEVLRENEIRDNDFELIIKALLLKLLVLVGREFKKEMYRGAESAVLYQRHRDALQNALQFINERYTDDISLEDAARVAMFLTVVFPLSFQADDGQDLCGIPQQAENTESRRIAEDPAGQKDNRDLLRGRVQ